MGVKNYIGELTLNGKEVATVDQIQDALLSYSKGLKYSKEMIWGVWNVYVVGRGSCTDVNIVIPSALDDEKVYRINDGAFRNSTDIISVTIPRSITNIGSGAFENCSSLTSIFISNNVWFVGENAFRGCSKLTIYCEAESKPDDWDDTWNGDCPVIWNSVDSFDGVNEAINEINIKLTGDLTPTSVTADTISLQNLIINGKTLDEIIQERVQAYVDQAILGGKW